MIDVDRLVFDIIEEFEQILANNNIIIPDEEREGKTEEVCIFGNTYYYLEERIKEILEDNLND